MSDVAISALIALGASGWFFNKLQRSTGRADVAKSGVAAAMAGLLIFIFIYIALKIFVPK